MSGVETEGAEAAVVETAGIDVISSVVPAVLEAGRVVSLLAGAVVFDSEISVFLVGVVAASSAALVSVVISTGSETIVAVSAGSVVIVAVAFYSRGNSNYFNV